MDEKAVVVDWEMDLCDRGPSRNDCCYAWFCPQCAMASVRVDLDDSIWCFNLVCITPVNVRWMVRTALRIEGTPEHDCCLTTWCLCCVANQTLQTMKKIRKQSYEESRRPGGGSGGNRDRAEETNRRKTNILPAVRRTQTWEGDVRCSKWWTLQNCLSSFFCLQCMLSLTLEEGVGIPCWMGCCCTSPCGAKNILRSHYRIGAVECRNECCDDCFVPSLLYALTWMAPPPTLLVSALYFTKFNVMMQQEVQARSHGSGGGGANRPPQRTKNDQGTEVERRYLADHPQTQDDQLFDVAAANSRGGDDSGGRIVRDGVVQHQPI